MVGDESDQSWENQEREMTNVAEELPVWSDISCLSGGRKLGSKMPSKVLKSLKRVEVAG